MLTRVLTLAVALAASALLTRTAVAGEAATGSDGPADHGAGP